ncbi:Hypothetical predicted protein, partial [Pelobates cultripes]
EEYHKPAASQFSHMQLRSFLHKHTDKTPTTDGSPPSMTAWEQKTTKGAWTPAFKPLSWCYQLLRPAQHFADSNPA